MHQFTENNLKYWKRIKILLNNHSTNGLNSVLSKELILSTIHRSSVSLKTRSRASRRTGLSWTKQPLTYWQMLYERDNTVPLEILVEQTRPFFPPWTSPLDSGKCSSMKNRNRSPPSQFRAKVNITGLHLQWVYLAAQPASNASWRTF